jgi:hypothetical protein
MELPDDLLGIVLLRCPAAAGRIARVSVAWARVARAHRVAVAAALGLGDRLARCAARLGDEAELEAIRLTIGTTDHQIANVAVAHQQWAALEWCVRHIAMTDDQASILAANAKLVWNVDLPWGGELVVWDKVPKQHVTPDQARAELAPECVPERLRAAHDSVVMGLYAVSRGRTTGTLWEMWWPRGPPTHRVEVVCHVMTRIRPLGRYTAHFSTSFRDWPTDIPVAALAFHEVRVRFEPVDSSQLPEEVGIEFCAWWMPQPPRIDRPFLCGGGFALSGMGADPAVDHWRRCELD